MVQHVVQQKTTRDSIPVSHEKECEAAVSTVEKDMIGLAVYTAYRTIRKHDWLLQSIGRRTDTLRYLAHYTLQWSFILVSTDPLNFC